MIVSFCGHRHIFDNKNDLKTKILEILEKFSDSKDLVFLCGAYGDFDRIGYSCACKIKEKNSDAKIVFVSPYYDSDFIASKKEIYPLIDEVVYPNLENVPKKFCILERNKYIIDESDLIIAYVRRKIGSGAYQMLDYARKKNKKIHNLFVINY